MMGVNRNVFPGQPVVIFAAYIIATSCSVLRQPTIQDSDNTLIIYRDTTYIRDTVVQWHIPDEHVQATADTSSHLETSLAESDAYIRGGVLVHQLRNKSEQIVPINVTIPYRVTSTASERVKVQTVIREVPADLTKAQKLLMTLGKTLLLMLLVGAIATILRR